MDAFDLCTGCRCHIKRHERRCPFCGTSHVGGPALSRKVARMSRARWLAFGSTLTLMSCTDSASKPDATDDAAGVDTAQSDSSNDALAETSSDDATDTNIVADAGDEAAADAPHADAEDAPSDSVATDIASRDDSDGDVAPDGTSDAIAVRDAYPDVSVDGGMDVGDDGGFPCCHGGTTCSTVCDRKTQVCDLTYIPGPGRGCFTIHTDAGDYPAQCMPEPSCWCIDPFFVACGSGPSSTYSCRDDGGGVVISCNGCYGAPPVRWERWVDPTRGVA
jgi:hypothetical protein